jgi:biopolymer transport protein ExbD/biopolymer transport protein TolR
MGMNVGSKKGVVPVMNVTPLVDIVLVLLIIFMVITPLMMKRFFVYTPKQEKKMVDQPEPPADDSQKALVLYIASDKTININAVSLPLDQVSDRLQRMFAAREDHLLFFDAEDDVDYGFAVQVMDQARAGGATTIAPLTMALSKAPAAEEQAAGGAAPPAAP